ncbi:hypothetical protein [Streptomyces avicenniae]|uniref:hypothetical protein n=1 Tax=Streptomyces avicenniae TaxID=500153 RepID=UPI00069BB097|nr:hypothetical protein [Streptomyces avicenniae]
MLRELVCDVEAPPLLDAVAHAVRRIRLIDGLRAVGVTLPDIVTLDEAAQHSGHGARSLIESGEGTVFCSWGRNAIFLRDVGAPVPDVPQDLVIAEQALRLVNALNGADVSPGRLRAPGPTN